MRSSFASVGLAAVVLSSFAPSSSAQQIEQITDFLPNDVGAVQLDDSGNRVVGWWRGDPLGTNPNRNYQLFLWDRAAETLIRLSGIESTRIERVDITDDGSTIVFTARGNPLGTNADLSDEIYSIAADGSGLTQITNFPAGVGTITQLSIAGSGNRIAFAGDLDPINGTPSGIGRIFVINPNGSGQLAVTLAASGQIGAVSISDDGERLAFTHDGDLGTGTVDGRFHLYRIKWNRQELMQFAGGSEVPFGAISGDGQTIFYRPAVSGIRTTDWDETSTVSTYSCTTNQCPTEMAITDDGAWVYFIRRTSGVPGAPPALARIAASGGADSTLATPTDRAELSQLKVAGGGSRLIALVDKGELPGVPNADASEELFSLGTTGLDGERLTDNEPWGFVQQPAIAPDGESAAFVLNGILAIDMDGGNLRQLTVDGGVVSPSISSTGTVVFTAFDDLTTPTVCQGFAGGLIYEAAMDGSALTALTDESNCNATRNYTSVSLDGSLVGWQANTELYVAPTSGGAELLVENGGTGIRQLPTMSGDGDWLVFSSDSDANLPGNTQFQVFRVPTDGSLTTQALTTDNGFSSSAADVSEDGERIVFNSLADPIGTNSDHNFEIFLWEELSGIVTQLTDTTACENREPQVSGNGRWVYFKSDCGFYGVSGDLAFRLDIDHGTLERITGTLGGGVFVQGLRDRPSYAVGTSGDRAVLANGGQLYAIRFDAAPTVSVGTGDPTALFWTADPRYVGYDVIRGEIAGLAPGVVAGETNLGPVVCLETNSTDTSIVGFEDALQPIAGQALFYLYRGRVGSTEPPAGWGPNSGGGDRLPASGGCSDAPM